MHLAHAVAPVVGPRTGAVVTAENAAPGSSAGEYDIDALLPLDRDVRPGQTSDFDVVLVLNPRGCNDGGTLWSSNWPAVTVEALGRSYDRHGGKDFAFHRNGATPGCTSMGADRRPAGPCRPSVTTPDSIVRSHDSATSSEVAARATRPDQT